MKSASPDSRFEPKTPELPRGREAYNEVVRILRSFHSDVPLPLAGHSVRHGQLVLEKDWLSDSKCPIAVSWIRQHPAFPLHAHRFHTITVILGGEGSYVVNEKNFSVATGDTFVQAWPTQHGIDQPKALSVLNICYDPQLLGIHANEFPDATGYRALFEVEPSLRRKRYFDKHFCLNGRQLALIESLATKMDAEIQGAEPGYVSVARAQLLEIIALLSRWYLCADQLAASDPRRITKAMQWIESNFNQEFDMDTLCKISGLSRRHFFRIFKACTKRTPVEYLRDLRLRKAEDLLRDPTMTITTVAFACGFQDSNHFSRLFKTFTGTTPRQYQQTHQLSEKYTPSHGSPPVKGGK
jgi:AraC-like DNA-binding protein/quercetin dioxygenase-like cupin family protein